MEQALDMEFTPFGRWDCIEAFLLNDREFDTDRFTSKIIYVE